MFMSVVRGAFAGTQDIVIAAHWKSDTERGVQAALGSAGLGLHSDTLGFIVSNTKISGHTMLGSAPIAPPHGAWALRVDEVAFPVGAVAHRHTHSGSGWRHLVSGELRIEAEHATTVMTAGDSWFEPAHSPVRAVALQTQGLTRFVRCMAIPFANVGRSTFQLESPEDAALPRLQVTHRHFDHPVQVDAG